MLIKTVRVFNVFVASFLVFAFIFSTNAQEFDFNEDDLLFSDIDSVFTASKFEQKITEAPARISIVTANEINRYGYRSLSDVLNTLPGFQTSDEHSYTYVGTRGFAIPGDYNTRMLLLVDGHRVNENLYSGFVVDNGLSVNINLIERIEVVRGSASSLYGNNAFFGVINIITKRGRDFQGAQVIAGVGDQNTKELTLSYGQRFDNDVEILFSASHDESDGNDHLYYSEFDSPINNNGYAEDNDSGDNNSVFASINYLGFTLTGSYQNQEKTIPTASFDTLFNDDRTTSWEKRAYVDMKYQTLLANGTDVTARLFYDKYSYTGHWAYDYSDEGDLSDIEIWKEKANGAWWGSEFLASNTFFTNHHITVGAEYRDSIQEEQFSWDSYDTFLDLDTISSTWGVYLQDDILISDTFSLNIGIRYDQSSSFDSSVNPRIAAIWHPYSESTFKLIYGSAFRSPNVYELNYHDSGISQKAPDSLKPEDVQSYEFIIEQKLSENVNLVVSLFNNDITDLIALTTDQSDGLLVFVNQDAVTSKGGEIELQGQWASGWRGAMSYSHQNSKYDTTSEHLPNAPRNQVKFNILTPTFMHGISAGLNMQYESSRLTLAGEQTDHVLLSNITLLKESLLKGLDLSVGAYNLFDEKYSQPGSEEHYQDQLAQYGRTYRIKINYAF